MRRVLIVLALTGTAAAAPVDTVNFTEINYITNFSSLGSGTGIEWAPDGSGRLFVPRKTGEVRIVQHNHATAGGMLVATPWATISPLHTNGESGVIGMCFDPNFLNNRYVYFFVTVSASEQQIIRYTDDPGSNTGGGKTTIVAGLPTLGSNHNGGAVAIGPDGRLYWAIGDNTVNANTDGNLTSLAAKVGRANRFTGAALNDNPFFDGAGTNADHIWARGFRNPYTMTFQPGRGRLWLNVVGSSYGGGTQPPGMPGFEQVFIVGRGDHGGWNDYENTQVPGFLPPVIAYRTGGTMSAGIAADGAQRAAGVVTFTTTSWHPFRAGAKVTISGVGDTSFNGSHYVVARLGDMQFTVAQAAPDAESGGGSATTLQIGSFTPPSSGGAAVTGGCFYDSTAWPAAYHGNFFAGDTVSGTTFRATLDVTGAVPTSVDLFSTTTNFQQVDTAVGPDGALYFLGYGNGQIRRTSHNSAAQNLIVQPTAFNVVEGGNALFLVRLAQAPGADVSVTVAKLGGDADLSGGATLTFTGGNWQQPQAVVISAAEDADLTNDSATFRVTSPGLTGYDVQVNGIDNDEPALVLSQSNLAITEGGSGTFTVNLAAAPAAPVTVNVTRASGDADISVSAGAVLSFNAGNFSTPQMVTIAAAEDADTMPDSAVISVTLAGEPVRILAVTATDNELVPPAFTSSPVLAGVLGQPYSYDADATGNPAPAYSFQTAPAGMSINNTTGLISWTPSATGSFAVAVRASGSGSPATQSFTIVISADMPPVASITSPAPGAVIGGASAEFFGDGSDDAGTIKAEFFVDGVLRHTDVNSHGHYHIGGTHGLFDTTLHNNGPHILRMRVSDTIGQTGEQEIPILIGNGAAAWRAEKFTPAEQASPLVSGDLADPEGDGIPNLFEYLFDTPPKASAQPRHPVARIEGGYLVFEFVRAKWAADLTLRVEASSDLVNWVQIDPLLPANQTGALEDTPAPGLQTLTVRDVVPQPAVRFMRLRASRQ